MENLINFDDSDLLSLLKEGNIEAFNTLFKKYYQPLCAYAHRYVGHEDLEEIVQDLFLWLWNNHDDLDIHTSLSSYLSVPLMLAVSIKLLKMRLNSVLKPSIGKIIQAMIPLSIIKSKN